METGLDPAVATIVRYEFTIDDYREMVAHLSSAYRRRASLAARIAGPVAFFAVTYCLFRVSKPDRSFMMGMFGAGVPLIVFSLVVVRVLRSVQRRLEPRPDGALLCPHRLTSTSEELLLETPTWRSTYKWSAFHGVDETKSLLLLKLEPSAMHAVPKRAFADSEELARFRREVEQRIRTAAIDRAAVGRSSQLLR